MPKINVYLPDELADAVKDAGLPVSAICQRALEQAVGRVAEVRAAMAAGTDPAEALAGLTQLTERTRRTLALAIEQARAEAAPDVDTGHLLGAILAEGTNLALHVLRAADVDLDRLTAALAEPAAAEPPVGDGAADATDDALRFSAAATAALQAAVGEAVSLDHNYVGCEHLLLGLAAEAQGRAAGALRAQGAEHRALRRAVVAALAGYVHLRAQGQQAAPPAPSDAARLVAEVVRGQLAPITERLATLERHVGLGTAGS